MTQIILVIHILLALALIGVVLLQRSEGGGLGIGGGGGGGGGMGGMFTGRGAANLLTRATAILATAFIGTSLLLAILSGAWNESGSILDDAPTATEGAPSTDSTAPAPAADEGESAPAEPAVPIR